MAEMGNGKSFRKLQWVGTLILALILGQVVGGLAAFANHGINPTPLNDRTCYDNGRYYHVHWARESTDPERDLWYRYYIVDANGSYDYPTAITLSVGHWNDPPYSPPDQDFVQLNNDQITTDYDVRVQVDRYTTENYLGKTDLDPFQCTYPQSNEGTHAKGYAEGSFALVKLNSDDIEAQPDALMARRWAAAHELGHAIALGHRGWSPETRVMYPLFDDNATTVPLDDDINMLSTYTDPYGRLHPTPTPTP